MVETILDFLAYLMLKVQQVNFDLNHHPMMVMFGTTSSDGMTMTSYFKKNLQTYNDDKVKLVPRSVHIDPMSKDAKQLGEKIFDFYLGERGACESNLQQFFNLMTDSYFFIPQTIHARLNQLYHPNITQYLYEFDFDGKLNFLKKALNMTKFKGSCHFDDLSYLYRHQIIDVSVREDSREYQMRKKMCKLWTNFAKYGNPTPLMNNPISTKWEPVKSNDRDLKYLILNDNPRTVKNIHSERIKFWREIFEKYNGSFLNPIC
ncbi:hypothetical protein PVAND_007501 [Polypedilum vanderplanki]|uniref:Carboxylesterase type B domain-containing protein n=1 Tax=Polypedilum vanderplanki TaxID=319348 RepID=A0A9J6C6V3_POLVA|nr:hypothetical protein PVAND_007501 [Polypedilum vanderplanki]